MSHECVKHGLGISSLACTGSTGAVFFLVGRAGQCAPDGRGEAAFAAGVSRIDGAVNAGGAGWSGTVGAGGGEVDWLCG